MKKDRITGGVGLLTALFFFYMTITGVRLIPNAVEPGPRLMPYLAVGIIALCSIGLILTSLKRDDKPQKPYFPKGGVKKITISYLLLVVYGVALTLFGFLLTTPFAMMAFIQMLKAEHKVKPLTTVIVSIAVTAGLYLMFVKGFSIKLPTGTLL